VNDCFKGNIPQSRNVIENTQHSTCSWSSFPLKKKERLTPNSPKTSRRKRDREKTQSSKECDDLDFNAHVLRETSDLDSRTSRERLISGEVFSVFCVHLSKVVHVTKEDRGLDDVFHGSSSSLEDFCNVGEDETGLFGDCPSAELSSCRIEGDLARSKQHAVGLDGLAVRADGFGCLVCGNNFLLLLLTAAATAAFVTAAAASITAATLTLTCAFFALLAATFAVCTTSTLRCIAGTFAAFTCAFLALLAATFAVCTTSTLGCIAGTFAIFTVALAV